MDFSEHLRFVDEAIASKDHQKVIDLCNQGIKQFNYSLLLAEKRGNARFNLKLYEDALVDFHNVLEAGINANECRMKICIINDKLDKNSKRLQRENYRLIKDILNNDPSYRERLEPFFGKGTINEIEYTIFDISNVEQDVEFDPVIYKMLNRDLKTLSNLDLYNHYKKHGVGEGRISSLGTLKNELKKKYAQAPEAFSIEGYKFLNQDVQRNVESMYYGLAKEYRYLEHYLSDGLKENRSYSLMHPLVGREDSNQMESSIGLLRHYEQFMNSKRVVEFNKFLFDKPLISFLISAGEEPKYLLNLLLSLESQIDQRFEVILIDRHPKTPARELFYKKIKTRVLFGDVKTIPLDILNHAVDLAKGVWVVSIDPCLQAKNDLVGNLLEHIQTNPKVGLVGGKLINSLSRIDSFGGIASEDGIKHYIGSGYGKDSFWTSFIRRVNYLPPQFFATKKSLLLELGKFNKQAPSLESAIQRYSQGVQDKDYWVTVDPSLLLTSFESKASQNNQDKLNSLDSKKRMFDFSLDKPLFSHFSKKILYIDDSLPDPSLGIGLGRAKSIIDELLGRNCFVTHVSTSIEKNELTQIDEMFHCNNKNIEFIKYCDLQKIRFVLSTRENFYDYVVVSRKFNIQYYLSLFKNVLGKHKTVFDIEALYSLRDFILKKPLGFGAVDYDEYLKSEDYLQESADWAQADRLWFASKVEMQIYQRSSENTLPSYEVGHVLVGEMDKTPLAFENRRGLVFIGTVYEKSSPNADSLELLISRLIPDIRKSKLKDEPFYIIGNIFEDSIKKKVESYCKTDPNTFFLPSLEDMRPILSLAKVFIAPTRIAAGIPHKLTSPAQYGIPIITSDLIAQQVENGRHYFNTCSSLEGFIKNIQYLYENKDAWLDCSKLSFEYAKRDLMVGNYVNAYEDLVTN